MPSYSWSAGPESASPSAAALSQTMPSALSYKERCALAAESGALYNRLYCNFESDTAWDRLYSDAGTRHVRAQSARPYVEGTGTLQSAKTLSGFCSNTTDPSATYTQDSFKLNLSNHPSVVSVESLHPMVAKKFKKKNPVEFMVAVRPDAETTSQTMRMMGMYSTDKPHAQRFGMIIPHMTPGGPNWFHPDVVLTQRRTAVHPAWATASSGLAFGGVSGAAPKGSVTATTGSGGLGGSRGPHARPHTAIPAAASSTAGKRCPPARYGYDGLPPTSLPPSARQAHAARPSTAAAPPRASAPPAAVPDAQPKQAVAPPRAPGAAKRDLNGSHVTFSFPLVDGQQASPAGGRPQTAR